MTDYADKLRDILELTDCSRGQWEPLLDALVTERDRLREALEAISWMSVVMPDGSVNTTASYRARVALEEGVTSSPQDTTCAAKAT